MSPAETPLLEKILVPLDGSRLSATILTILHGTAVGLVPVRVMQDELERRRAKRVAVAPEIPAHRVSICYQISEFGPGLKDLVDLTRELVARHKLFV